MQDDRGVGGFAQAAEAVAVKLADGGLVEGGDERLVEELDADDDVLVLRLRVLLGDGGEDVEGLLDGITLGPSGWGDALA